MNELFFSPEAEFYLNTAVPNQARIFDFLLGGSANFSTDRSAVAQLTQLIPSFSQWVRLRRAFTHEAAHILYQNGFRQFLNLGSGMPAENHLHQAIPDANIIYSDTNPVAVSYGQSLFAEFINIDYIYGGAGQIHQMLQNPTLRRIIDRQEKVAINLNMLPLTLSRSEAAQLSRELHEWAPPGSQIFHIIQSRSPQTPPEKYKDLLVLSKKIRCPLYIHPYQQAVDLAQPWLPITIVPLAQFLGLPKDFFAPGNQENIETVCYAAFFTKGAI